MKNTDSPKINLSNYDSGFTIIEMLFYILFITFIVGSTLMIAQQLLRNNSALKTGVSIEEEANFILKKISWAVNDVDNIILPLPNTENQVLSVNKNSFTPNPVKIGLNNNRITIERGSSPEKFLSNERFNITDLNFSLSEDVTGTYLLNASFLINGREFKLTRKIR